MRLTHEQNLYELIYYKVPVQSHLPSKRYVSERQHYTSDTRKLSFLWYSPNLSISNTRLQHFAKKLLFFRFRKTGEGGLEF